MERITWKDVKALADKINEVKGTPKVSWTQELDGKYKSNEGNYHISRAYGGVSLHRMVNDAGGITDVFGCGHIPKRSLYNRMRAFLEGCCK